ncbi:cupin [Myxococcus stipitatus DSM 14675]|uniref:Cupin n=1 Tax=Myxococcus stipitatus (strain DSM 14675 / JCM 12634 / Mx s8) TaxID=1278073 RepID=L7UQW7_MYXSD|nr:cupin domain-containing protein [Myxococcus stipitatus]AGC48939.1 cupin [Myxococcus stipitatus DSM 14675]
MSPRLLLSALALTGLGVAHPAWATSPEAPKAPRSGTMKAPTATGPTSTSPAKAPRPDSATAATGTPSTSPAKTSGTTSTTTPAATASTTPAGTTSTTTPAATASTTPAGIAPTSPVRHRVTPAEAPRHLIAGGKGRATLFLNASTGATAASLTLLELQPGGEVPEHTHDTSVEILYIEDGAADMTVAGQTLRVSKGDAVYIPAGAKHSAKVVSPGAPFKAVQVYAGSGPEQRFTQGPRETAPHGP